MDYTSLISFLKQENSLHNELGLHAQREMSILFVKFRDFNQLSGNFLSKELIDFLNSYLNTIQSILNGKNGYLCTCTGESIIILFPDSVNDALNTGNAILKNTVSLNNLIKEKYNCSVSIGVGLHTGIVTIGTIGTPEWKETIVLGDSVPITSQLGELSKSYNTNFLISENAYFNLNDAEKKSIRFVDRIKVVNNINYISIFDVFENESPRIIQKRNENKQLFEDAITFFHSQELSKAESLLKDYLKLVPDDFIAQMYLGRCQKTKTNETFASPNLNRKILWSDYLSIYYDPIDNQHKELIERVSGLLTKIKDGKGIEETHQMLLFLEEYTVKHFSTEEKIMLKYDYPYYEEHKKQHEIFINELSYIKTKNLGKENMKLHLLLRIESQLVNWIINHICVTDKKLGNFLNSPE
ncbi:MAG: bacteriohemerythrin [Leptospiraceae bacterium]|nr:bacteriohemerythrin [Leptospiraceae bacterium]MCP5495712.1 bacteriohemerythrin [Leptospiraceae bacterium]